MEGTLVIVTLLSLALAIGLAIVVWRLLYEERQRADARVALLEEGLAASLAAEIVELHSAGDPDWLAQFPSSSTPDVAMSATTRARRPLAPPLAIWGGGVAIVLSILALWWVGHLKAPGTSARAAGGANGTSAAAAAMGAPLELVALEQTRAGEALTIHGVVRNPPAGAMIDRLAVVVAFFDTAGQQLASVRAPLDFRTLAPGDESPFQVTTPVPTGVARYRVSFRRDEGTIVPHVDRRQQEAS